MKHLILTSILFITTCTAIVAQNDVFAQANELYAIGDYNEAAVLYESLIGTDLQNDMLYYNLANTYFKQGELGKSILFYERALLLNPLNKDIRHNLAFAQSKITDNIESEQSFFIASWMQSLRLLLSESTWMWLSLIAFICFLAGILIFFFSANMAIRKSAFGIAMLTLVVSIAAFCFCSTTHSENIEQRNAIIMTGIVNAKASPDKSGTDLFVLHEGTKVRIYDQVGEWVEIHVGNNVGWIPFRTLERI